MEDKEIFLGALKINNDIIKPYLCNSVNENGEAFVRDTYDLDSNIITKRVGRNILSGNEKWRYDTETKTFCYLQSNKFNETGLGRYDTMMSTHYRWKSFDKNIQESMFQGNENGEIMFRFKKEINDLEYFKSWLKEQYSKGKPVEVYFALQFPIIIKKEKIYNWCYLERINREYENISFECEEGSLEPIIEKNCKRTMNRKK